MVRQGMSKIANAVVNAIAGSPLIPRRVRRAVLRTYGLDVEGVNVNPRCFFGGRDIAIGPGSFVNVGCVFDNTARIEVGAECRIGIGVMFLTSSHELGAHERRAGELASAPVRVGDGCWI